MRWIWLCFRLAETRCQYLLLTTNNFINTSLQWGDWDSIHKISSSVSTLSQVPPTSSPSWCNLIPIQAHYAESERWWASGNLRRVSSLETVETVDPIASSLSYSTSLKRGVNTFISLPSISFTPCFSDVNVTLLPPRWNEVLISSSHCHQFH